MSLPAHFPELKVIPADFKSALASEIIALGYVEVENLDPKAEKRVQVSWLNTFAKEHCRHF